MTRQISDEERGLMLKETAQTLVIRGQEEYDFAAQFLVEVKTQMKRVEEALDPQCKAAYKAWQTANDQKKKFLAPYQMAEAEIKSRMGAYQVEQRRIAEEAERKAIEEATKQEEKERKKLIKQGRHEEAEMVFVPVVAPSHEVAKAEGTSVRMDCDIEVRDYRKFLEWLLNGGIEPSTVITVKPQALKQWVKFSGSTKIPGCIVTDKAVVSAKGRV